MFNHLRKYKFVRVACAEFVCRTRTHTYRVERTDINTWLCVKFSRGEDRVEFTCTCTRARVLELCAMEFNK